MVELALTEPTRRVGRVKNYLRGAALLLKNGTVGPRSFDFGKDLN